MFLQPFHWLVWGVGTFGAPNGSHGEEVRIRFVILTWFSSFLKNTGSSEKSASLFVDFLSF